MTQAVNPKTMVEKRGIAIARNPPTVVQRIPILSTTKKPLTARYTIIATNKPICENVSRAERIGAFIGIRISDKLTCK